MPESAQEKREVVEGMLGRRQQGEPGEGQRGLGGPNAAREP